MHDHDEQKGTEHNLFVRRGKSEAELALDVLYYWSYWQVTCIYPTATVHVSATSAHARLLTTLCRRRQNHQQIAAL